MLGCWPHAVSGMVAWIEMVYLCHGAVSALLNWAVRIVLPRGALRCSVSVEGDLLNEVPRETGR